MWPPWHTRVLAVPADATPDVDETPRPTRPRPVGGTGSLDAVLPTNSGVSDVSTVDEAEPASGLANRLRAELPNKSDAKNDGIAGLINAVSSVPDGLASASLAGVNPVFGLYAGIFGRLGGGFLSSSQLMQIATTSAAALAAGEAITRSSTEARNEELFMLVLLIGAVQIAAGVLRLGQLVRFVSHSVMTGFLFGVAVLLILDQLAGIVKYDPEGANEVVQFWNLITNANEFDLRTMGIGAITFAIIFAVGRTRAATFAPLLALLVPTVFVMLVGWEDKVDLVRDVSEIPAGLPMPGIPSLDAFSLELTTAAFAIAAIILVQGAGVAQSFPNPRGKPASASQDFIAQGAANVTNGIFSAIPVGGSVGQTALNVSTGALSRWSMIFGGVWMLIIVLLIPGLVEIVPMSSLAALMIVAGYGAINLPEATSIWRTGWGSRIPILVTFAATLLISIPAAVGVGVLLSMLLFVAASSDVAIRALEDTDAGPVEMDPPRTLQPRSVTVLNIYGSLFFAGARNLERLLPPARGVDHAAIILRLRGRHNIGATFIEVLDRYATDIAAGGGRLYLTGVDDRAIQQLEAAEKLDLGTTVRLYPATPALGDATRRATSDARAWLAQLRGS